MSDAWGVFGQISIQNVQVYVVENFVCHAKWASCLSLKHAGVSVSEQMHYCLQQVIHHSKHAYYCLSLKMGKACITQNKPI